MDMNAVLGTIILLIITPLLLNYMLYLKSDHCDLQTDNSNNINATIKEEDIDMNGIVKSLEDGTFDKKYLDRNIVMREGENKYKGFVEYFNYKVSCPKELLDKYNIPYIISKSELKYGVRHKEFDPENGYKEYTTYHDKEYLIIPDLYFKLFYMVNYALPDNKYIIIPLSYIINNTLDYDFVSSGFINKQDIEQMYTSKYNMQSKQKIDFKWFMRVKPARKDRYERVNYELLPECLSVCGYNNYYVLHYQNDYNYLKEDGYRGINVIIPENEILQEDIESLRTSDGFYKFTIFDDYYDYRSVECHFKTNVITIKKCYSAIYTQIPVELRNRILNDKLDVKEYLHSILYSFTGCEEVSKFAILNIENIEVSI